MNKEELIKAWKEGVLNSAGKDKLIDMFANPEKRELHKETIRQHQTGKEPRERQDGFLQPH